MGTIFDETPNALDLTTQGSTEPVIIGTGYVGYSIELNTAQSQYLTRNNDDLLRIGTGRGNGYMAWLKMTATANSQPWFCNWDGTAPRTGFQTKFNSDSQDIAFIATGYNASLTETYGVDLNIYYYGIVVNDGAWRNWVTNISDDTIELWMYDPTTQTLKCLFKHRNSKPIVYNGAETIGLGALTNDGYATTPTQLWGGEIDDHRVYNQPLTANDIKTIIEATTTDLVTTIIDNHPADYTHFYDMRWFSGTLASTYPDGSNMAYTGTGTQASSNGVHHINGTSNTASLFDGAYGYFLQSNEFSHTNFTLSCWVNFTTVLPSAETVVSYGSTSGGNYGYTLDTLNGRIRFSARNGTNNFILADTGFINDGNWHHILVDYDDATTTFEVYVDGVSIGTLSVTNGIAYHPTTNYWSIGCDYRAGTASLYYFGSIDLVTLFDRGVTANERLGLRDVNENIV